MTRCHFLQLLFTVNQRLQSFAQTQQSGNLFVQRVHITYRTSPKPLPMYAPVRSTPHTICITIRDPLEIFRLKYAWLLSFMTTSHPFYRAAAIRAATPASAKGAAVAPAAELSVLLEAAEEADEAAEATLDEAEERALDADEDSDAADSWPILWLVISLS